MLHPLLDLFCPPLVEEIRPEVATDTPTDVHSPLIPVAAVGALPDMLTIIIHDSDLTVEATHLAMVCELRREEE